MKNSNDQKGYQSPEKQHNKDKENDPEAVSYTHLDVYKRQSLDGLGLFVHGSFYPVFFVVDGAWF